MKFIVTINALNTKKLDYADGQHSLKFDSQKYDFQNLVCDALLEKGNEARHLEEAHNLPGIGSNIEKYRQVLFALFRSPQFQEVYKQFGADLIDSFFNDKALIQKTPTVRIQLPGADSTSYHSDGWYGHGKSVRSFWLPLTRVTDGNTLYMAEDIKTSMNCLAEILDSRASLEEINQVAQKVCNPFNGGFGDVLSFSSDMIHGAQRNSTDWTRVSFDFRIAPDPNDLGSKPKSNFYSRAELDQSEVVVANTSEECDEALVGITYSNLCGGVSAKSQLMLCAAFCEANNIDIIGNEAEIIALDYMPVIRHYLTRQSAEVNAVVVFSTSIFHGDKELAKNILELSKASNRKIVFCAETIIFDENVEVDSILALI